MRATREFALPAPYRSPFQRIAPGVHTLPGQTVGRVYVLESSDGLTLVDTGLARRARNVLTMVARAGHSARQIRRVLLTHVHPDHVGGLATLQANADVEVFASEASAAGLRGRVRTVADGDVIGAVAGGITVLSTPGHLAGHVSFWLPEQGTLFAGDTLTALGGLGTLPPFLNTDAAQTARDAERLSHLDPDVICCGHGPPVTRNAAARLRALARGAGARDLREPSHVPVR